MRNYFIGPRYLAFRCTRREAWRQYAGTSLAVTASPTSSPRLLAPLQELAEQSLAIGFALGHTASRPIHESLEIATGIILG